MKLGSRLMILLRGLGRDWGILPDPLVHANHGTRRGRLGLLLFLVLYFPVTEFCFGTSCAIQSTLGFPCPACGSTRAALALLHGNWREALRWHPLIFLSLFLLAAALLYYLYCAYQRELSRIQGVAWSAPRWSRSLRVAVAAVLLLYFVVYIYRMSRDYPSVPPLTYNYKSWLGRILTWLGVL